jgi:hypothetical protein
MTGNNGRPTPSWSGLTRPSQAIEARLICCEIAMRPWSREVVWSSPTMTGCESIVRTAGIRYSAPAFPKHHEREPLLFKGNDFIHTDIEPALKDR